MRLNNELFIGAEYLNLEGRTIKHPALIKEYGNINTHKISTTPIKLLGLDLETNHLTSELKLIGFWNGSKYKYVTDNFLDVLFTMIKYAGKNNISLAYWNRLDPFVLYKQFLLALPEDKREQSLNAFSKIGGVWDKYKGVWKIPAVAEVLLPNGYYFGIKQAIRSCVQFYYRPSGGRKMTCVWAYDIALLYEYGLEREALGEEDKETHTYPNARLKYYSKGDEELHKIDWRRFKYRLVLQEPSPWL